MGYFKYIFLPRNEEKFHTQKENVVTKKSLLNWETFF
jgi:hypothetical protein